MSVFIAFLLVSCHSIFHFSLLCLQMQSFCIATVVVLRCNCIRFAWQKESILNEKDCFCEALHCLFWTVILQVVENQRFDANRLKLTNFESKISLCVQLAVLSGQKCKYCVSVSAMQPCSIRLHAPADCKVSTSLNIYLLGR